MVSVQSRAKWAFWLEVFVDVGGDAGDADFARAVKAEKPVVSVLSSSANTACEGHSGTLRRWGWWHGYIACEFIHNFHHLSRSACVKTSPALIFIHRRSGNW